MGKCASRDKSASSSRTPRFLFKKGAEKQQHQPAVSPDHPKPSSSKEEEKVVSQEEKVVEASEGAAGLVPVVESKTEAEPVIPAPPSPPAAPSAPSAPSAPPPPPPPPYDDADIDTTITTFDEQDAINAYSGRITLLSGAESSSASSSAYNTANPSPARSFRSPDSAVYLSGSEDMPSYRASPAHPVSKLTQASSTDEDPFLARAGFRKRESDEGGAALAGSSSAGFSGLRSGDDGAIKEPEVRSASPLQGEENWEMVSPKGLGPGEWVSVAKPDGQGSKEVAAPPVVVERGLQPPGQPVVETGGVASKAPVAGKSPEDEEADTVKSLGSDQSDEIETRSLTGDGGDYVLLGATEKGEKAGNTVDAAASEPTSSVAAGAITEVDPDSKSATPSDSHAIAKPAEPATAPTVESQAPVVEQRSFPVESAPMEVAAPVEVPETQIEEKAKLPVEKASSAPLVEEVPTSTQEDKDDVPLVAAPAAMKDSAAAKEEAQDSPFPEEKAAVTPAPVIVEEVDPAPITEEATPTPVAEDKVAAEEESTPEAPLLASETASEPASKTAPEPTSETASELASKTAPEPTSEPTLEPTSEPAPETASAPEPASVPDPVPEPASEPVSGPVSETVPGLAPEPASEPVSGPVSAPEPASVPDPVPEPASVPDFVPEPASVPDAVPEPASVPDPVPEPASEPVSGPVSEAVPGPAPEAPVAETKPTSGDSSWRTFKEEIQSKSGTTTPSEAAPTA